MTGTSLIASGRVPTTIGTTSFEPGSRSEARRRISALRDCPSSWRLDPPIHRLLELVGVKRRLDLVGLDCGQGLWIGIQHARR